MCNFRSTEHEKQAVIWIKWLLKEASKYERSVCYYIVFHTYSMGCAQVGNGNQVMEFDGSGIQFL